MRKCFLFQEKVFQKVFLIFTKIFLLTWNIQNDYKKNILIKFKKTFLDLQIFLCGSLENNLRKMFLLFFLDLRKCFSYFIKKNS